MDKPFWESKAFWFNTLALIVAVAASFGYSNFTADPQVDQYALVAVTVINLVIRLFFTKTNLTLQ